MAYFLQQLINGISLGMIYGLIAVGYTMVYGIIGMINFAHGDVFMIGAFVALISVVMLVSGGIMEGPAAILIVRAGGGYGGKNDRFLDLRVEDHAEPIAELRRLVDLHRRTFRSSWRRSAEAEGKGR